MDIFNLLIFFGITFFLGLVAVILLSMTGSIKKARTTFNVHKIFIKNSNRIFYLIISVMCNLFLFLWILYHKTSSIELSGERFTWSIILVSFSLLNYIYWEYNNKEK